MHLFDPDSSLKDNCLKAGDIEFAAWDFASHDHREKFRDSGHSPAQTAWLRSERIRQLQDALADGQLLALGIASDDPALEIVRIPANLFLSSSVHLNGENSSISGMNREFLDVRICRAIPGFRAGPELPKPPGRPNHLGLISRAWIALKSEIPDFHEWDKTSQNREIGEKVAALFPGQFPGKSRPGESTIRRHRRANPELFD